MSKMRAVLTVEMKTLIKPWQQECGSQEKPDG